MKGGKNKKKRTFDIETQDIETQDIETQDLETQDFHHLFYFLSSILIMKLCKI